MATEEDKYVLGKKVGVLKKIDQQMIKLQKENVEKFNTAIGKIGKWINNLNDKFDEFGVQPTASELKFLKKLEDDFQYYTSEKKNAENMLYRFEMYDQNLRDWIDLIRM